jgi:hypothetical protein
MKACSRTPSAQPAAMRVTLTVDLAPGVRSDMLICMILNGILAELTSAGLDTNHIGIDIAGYRPDHID